MIKWSNVLHLLGWKKRERGGIEKEGEESEMDETV